VKKVSEFITPFDLWQVSKEQYRMYLNAKKKSNLTSIHQMILFYAVECRLKSVLYRYYKKQMDKNSKGGKKLFKELMDHNIDILLNKLYESEKIPKRRNITCPKISLKKEDTIKYNIKEAHICWRYGIELEDNSEKLIVEWLEKVYSQLKKDGY